MMPVAKNVRLGDLDYDPAVLAMAGQEARLEQVDDLVASIGAEGQLQSLKVRISPEADRYYVTAGLRRLTALRHLRDTNGTMQGVWVSDETQVAVVLTEETDEAAVRQAVAENVQRVALTVGAEVRQFAELAKTETTKQIASRFGLTEKRVNQRLKLAGLHPDVLQALDDKVITISAAEAFTLEEDPAKQAKYLKKSGGQSYKLEPRTIRDAFTKKLVRSDSAIARHIGEEDYLAAGGAVLADQFSDAVYWISDDVVERLAAARTAALVDGWKADGWSFVETLDEFSPNNPYGLYGVRHLRPEGEGEDAAFTAEQKALSGVVYRPDASYPPSFGIVRKGTVLPGDDLPPPEPAPDFRRPGGNVISVLQLALGEAAAAKVESDPLLALRLLVAQMASSIIHDTPHWESMVHLSGSDVRDAVDYKADYPESFAELAAAAESLDESALLTHLAKLLSLTIRVRGNVDDVALRQLELINPDLLAAFDADAYFNALQKPLVALAYEDITGKKLKDGKLETMVGKTVVEAKAQGWLPPQLRLGTYAGPCHVTPVEVADASGDEDDEEFADDDMDDEE